MDETIKHIWENITETYERDLNIRMNLILDQSREELGVAMIQLLGDVQTRAKKSATLSEQEIEGLLKDQNILLNPNSLEVMLKDSIRDAQAMAILPSKMEKWQKRMDAHMSRHKEKFDSDGVSRAAIKDYYFNRFKSVQQTSYESTALMLLVEHTVDHHYKLEDTLHQIQEQNIEFIQKNPQSLPKRAIKESLQQTYNVSTFSTDEQQIIVAAIHNAVDNQYNLAPRLETLHKNMEEFITANHEGFSQEEIKQLFTEAYHDPDLSPEQQEELRASIENSVTYHYKEIANQTNTRKTSNLDGLFALPERKRKPKPEIMSTDERVKKSSKKKKSPPIK